MNTIDSGTALGVFDHASEKIFDIALPMDQQHSALVHPQNSENIFVFDLAAPKACLVNLATQSHRSFSALPGYVFGGHGALSANNLLWTTETAIHGGDGLVVARDANTLEVVAHYSSGGKIPHEISFIPEKNILVVGNEGLQKSSAVSNLSFIDPESGLIQNKVESNNITHSFRHFVYAPQSNSIAIAARNVALDQSYDSRVWREIFMQKKFREAYAYRRSKEIYNTAPMYYYEMANQKLKTIHPDKQIENQMAGTNSICLDKEKQIAAITHAAGNLVTFWDMKSQELLHAHSTGKESPRGIVFSKAKNCYYLQTYGGNFYRMADIATPPTLIAGANLKGFSHIFET